MKSPNNPEADVILQPYRMKINDLDRQIVDLLRQRYEVIREVGHLKAEKGIPSVLQNRVDEVREAAAKRAADLGLDEDFIRLLYAQLIEHSCDLEEEIIRSAKASQAKTTHS